MRYFRPIAKNDINIKEKKYFWRNPVNKNKKQKKPIEMLRKIRDCDAV
jgi:hypothetical protein